MDRGQEPQDGAGGEVSPLRPRMVPGLRHHDHLLTGVALRGWSFAVLGRYFTFTLMVSPDQPVVTAGPYRVLRHPSYTGILLGCMGVGLASANWAGLAAMTLLPLAILLWRIHIEENALLATLGDRYRAYAAHHKRLVPLVW